MKFRKKQLGFLGQHVPILFNQTVNPSFDLPLQSSLIPSRNTGSDTPTFTRATAAYQTDFEGKLNLLPSGAARMQGARYVRNLLSTKSNDFSNAAWRKSGTASVTGTNTINLPANNDFVYQTVNYTSAAGSTFVFSVTLSGSGTVVIYTGKVTYATATITLTATPTRYSVPVTLAAGQLTIEGYIWRNGTTATTVTASNAQIEDATGQTNQNPSEYVSVGVLSAPYHGAGVDGVKYFDTLNGNTVV